LGNTSKLVFKTAEIQIRDRLRPVDSATVIRLAESMKTHGLMSPITVLLDWIAPPDESEEGHHDLVLVAGLHRLEAARSLGWETIECASFDGDYLDAKMWEISENLDRADLSKTQRAEWIRRYAALLTSYSEREAAERNSGETDTTHCHISLADGRKAGPQHQPGVVAKIAAKTNLSKRTVQRALAPEKPISPPPAVVPSTAGPTKDPLDIPAFLDRRPTSGTALEPVVTAPEAPRLDQAVSERQRAAEEIADILAEVSQDRYRGIAAALATLGPAFHPVAKRFAAWME
jgi:hypothetical protein